MWGAVWWAVLRDLRFPRRIQGRVPLVANSRGAQKGTCGRPLAWKALPHTEGEHEQLT